MPDNLACWIDLEQRHAVVMDLRERHTRRADDLPSTQDPSSVDAWVIRKQVKLWVDQREFGPSGRGTEHKVVGNSAVHGQQHCVVHKYQRVIQKVL